MRHTIKVVLRHGIRDVFDLACLAIFIVGVLMVAKAMGA